MRVEAWNPNKFDETFENIAMERLEDAARIIAEKAKSKCEIGKISRPVYERGKYKKLPWTSRDPGRLRKSIRVVRKKIRKGKAFSSRRNVRVYAGHYTAYYAGWEEEFGSPKRKPHPFLRPALQESIAEIKSIIGAR